MSGLPTPALDGVPQEVLEHIALFSATESFLGPPSSLASLLATCRLIHTRLSLTSNPYLYAEIFAYKFDVVSSSGRLWPNSTTHQVLAQELQKRCINLKRIRGRLDAIKDPFRAKDDSGLHQLLFHMYLLMLENEGKNERQMREYAGIDDWLQEYWFSESGASAARDCILRDQWPPDNEQNSLAMWLFWFLLRPGLRHLCLCEYILITNLEEYLHPVESSWIALNVLKSYALGAHKVRTSLPFGKLYFADIPIWSVSFGETIVG